MIYIYVIIFLVVLYASVILWLHQKYPEIRWDWSSIDTKNMKFPNNFSWGTATASHQVEGGCDNNNWYKWESAFNDKGLPRIKDGQKAGDACDHWNRYKDDISLIKKLGVSHYRFSLEWSKIEKKKESIVKKQSNIIQK